MSTAQTRWNLVVPAKLDKSLRQFLAHEGRAKKGELSRFVQEAVSKHIFEASLKAARQHNKDVDPAELDSAIEEALDWARAQRR